ncbi:hypothetical protein CN918_28485 [Priestia megaterium]|nr:hypothetical protein CN918_28485 [Priestia megaterium]
MNIQLEDNNYHVRAESNSIQEATVIIDKDDADLDWQSVEHVFQPHRMLIFKNEKEILDIVITKEDRNEKRLPKLVVELIKKYETNEIEAYAASYVGEIKITR